jgi:hypothetical protein
MGLRDEIKYFLNNFNSKDFEIIGEILSWNDEKKLAFMMAKRIIEDDIDENDKT